MGAVFHPPHRTWAVLALGLCLAAAGAGAQDAAEPAWDARIHDELRVSLDTLAEVRKAIADEKIPLSEELHDLENRLIDARKEYEAVKRSLDRRNLDMNNLRTEITSREQEKAYLSNLLDEYIRNLETRLHIAELRRYQDDIEAARLAPENTNLKPAEVFARQAELVDTSVARLEEMLGGARFEGRAAGEDGLVKPGRFVLLGPVAYFAAEDGSLAGVAEQRLGSLEPSVAPFAHPENAALTRDMVNAGKGTMPFDGSLGNARKVEETRQSLGEHIAKGGVVMIPILGLAGAAVLVIVARWISLALVRMPNRTQVQRFLTAVSQGRHQDAATAARGLPGPAGTMLSAGAAQLDAPKDLIEEVMFEKLLETRTRLQRGLPFIAVAAASAPLLGLLGTVTGIINTFKLLTVFGSGDVKMLSGGISEALITTEFGLIVAIPTLLSHAFLSRRAKAIVDRMEQLAIAFMSELEKARMQEARTTASGIEAEPVPEEAAP